ncbi:MAG TPA: CPBP family intramembrane metalloprotease [Xanthomonadaceae bacterium]|nr:CPBP family intramembrane metalloprotease [Xanthomonadaceae bacterium]
MARSGSTPRPFHASRGHLSTLGRLIGLSLLALIWTSTLMLTAQFVVAPQLGLVNEHRILVWGPSDVDIDLPPRIMLDHEGESLRCRLDFDDPATDAFELAPEHRIWVAACPWSLDRDLIYAPEAWARRIAGSVPVPGGTGKPDWVVQFGSPMLVDATLGRLLAANLLVALLVLPGMAFRSLRRDLSMLPSRATWWLAVPSLYLVLTLAAVLLMHLGIADGQPFGDLVARPDPVRHCAMTEMMLALMWFAPAAAVVEELVFRGLFYRILSRRMSIGSVWLLSTTVFAALHLAVGLHTPWGAPLYFAQIFLAGSVLFALRHYSGSLWLPILAHALHNALLIGLMHANWVEHCGGPL